jgi:hypothetical protein
LQACYDTCTHNLANQLAAATVAGSILGIDVELVRRPKFQRSKLIGLAVAWARRDAGRRG